MTRVLVVANETIGSRNLLDTVLAKSKAAPEFQAFLVVPQSRPRHGNVVYDEAVRDAAQVRVDLARQFLAQEGLDVTGEVGDEDPFNATLDAVAEWRPDEIVISTLPQTSSGWLRRDLIERVQAATGLPVDHVVTDIAKEGLPYFVTLVVANRSMMSPKLLERLKARAAEERHLFIVVVPQESGDGLAARAARARLQELLGRLRAEGLVCAGFIGDPDPFDATLNALQTFNVSDIVISTFSETRSGWLRSDLIERVRGRTALPVEHVVAEYEQQPTA